MISYDKVEVRNALTIEDIFTLLTEWGGEPEYSTNGIIASTICHNLPGEGSRKLYFYENSNLFHCYTGCENPSFDIFELYIKISDIQYHKAVDLNMAVQWIACYFGIAGTYLEEEDQNKLEDWDRFDEYHKNSKIIEPITIPKLNEYNKTVLYNMNYNVKIKPWIDEGITQEVLTNAHIGFYPGGNQITIPHFDKDNRFIGLRGRQLNKDEASLYGKYRPVIINKQLYNHPLGMNLYNFNNSQNNIRRYGKAIIFESEKSTLLYQSYFGIDNDISVACCGSSISAYQIQYLLDAGVQEIIIAFDRQFQTIGDDEFKHLKANLMKIRNRFYNKVNISFIFDKTMITSYKASPIDEGKEKFIFLYKNRIIL